MADNIYQPSNLGGAPVAQPARPVTPTPPAPATSTTYAPSFQVTPLDYTSHVESGNRNIPQQIVDVNTRKGTPAQGYWQIIDPTWRIYARKAGVDLNQYPSAISAPRSVQAQVAALIPINQFGPNTQAALKAKYPGINVNQPLGAYGGTSGTAPSASTPAAPPPPTTIGGMLGMLNTPDSSGRSTMDNLGGMAPSSQASQVPQPNLQGQMAAGMGNVRQQQIAGQAQALAAALQQKAAQPLNWSSQPFGSTAGVRSAAPAQTLWGGQPVPMPGTTLNSVGNYGG